MESDENRGVYRKYIVKRTDGSHRKGGKHEHCNYFVLDLEHDPFAIPALKAYAEACRGTHPKLAENLELVLATRPCGCRSAHECMHIFAPRTPAEQLGELMRSAKEPADV